MRATRVLLAPFHGSGSVSRNSTDDSGIQLVDRIEVVMRQFAAVNTQRTVTHKEADCTGVCLGGPYRAFRTKETGRGTDRGMCSPHSHSPLMQAPAFVMFAMFGMWDTNGGASHPHKGPPCPLPPWGFGGSTGTKGEGAPRVMGNLGGQLQFNPAFALG